MSTLHTTLYISREYDTSTKKLQFLTLSVKVEKPATIPKSTHIEKMAEICSSKCKSDSKYAICSHTFFSWQLICKMTVDCVTNVLLCTIYNVFMKHLIKIDSCFH